MEETVRVVPAALEHARAVHELLCELEQDALDPAALYGVYEANLQNEDIRYFLAFVKERPAGFVSLHVQRLLHHAAAIGEIQEIVVARDLRGLGIGKALFLRALEAARERGCVQLEVCCRKTRLDSHAFYERMGMTASHFKFCLPLEKE